MKKAAGKRRRWTVIVPMTALAAWALGIAFARFTQPTERPLEVTAPPETQLAPIVLPPRARHLSGEVVGPDGVGIGDALIALVADDEPHWTYSDGAGRFALESLGRGAWTVTVSATGHLPFTTTLADDGTPVVVRLPDELRAMPKLAMRVTSSLTGRVAAAPQSELAGIEVLFMPTTPLAAIDTPFPRRVQCAADGTFALPDLQVGEYTLVVLPEWAQNGSWPDLSRPAGAPPRVWTHASGVESALELQIVAGAVRGVVADREQNALAGALVLVTSADSPERVWPPVTSDAQGAFIVPDLPPGNYTVAVRAGAGSHQAQVSVRANETSDLALPPLAVEQAR